MRLTIDKPSLAKALAHVASVVERRNRASVARVIPQSVLEVGQRFVLGELVFPVKDVKSWGGRHQSAVLMV